MFVARSSETGRLLALPGAPASDQCLSDRVVSGDEARSQSASLRCVDVHCDAPLVFRQGPKKTAHWAHLPGEGLDCAERENGEGEWHRMVTRGLLAGAYGHEYVMDGARADVVVRRTQSLNLTAIEVQHSPIKPETVLARHAAHKEAGMAGTVWIVDGEAVGVRDGVAWHTNGDPRLTMRCSWLIDLLAACRDTPRPYGCTVGLLVPRAVDGSHGLRLVRQVEFGVDSDGARTAVLRKWTERIGETTLREWGKGPDRVMDEHNALMERSRLILDSAATMRVKEWTYNPWRDGPRAA